MKVSKVSEMRNLDRFAIEKLGIGQEILMENAGEAVYFVILKEFGVENKRFAVFCGIGNNGGDGLVVARKLHSSGGEVKVFLLGDETKFKGATKQNFNIVSKMPIETYHVSSIESIRAYVEHCDAIVDAIFGTGLIRDASGIYKEAIQLINE
ncbi:Bifunctional NAD(P)H-hydrate repair enzyme Nnr [subsurface metagenome]